MGADPFQSHELNLTEEVPNPDALYKSLDMLSDDLQNGAVNDVHSGNRGKCLKTLFDDFRKGKELYLSV